MLRKALSLVLIAAIDLAAVPVFAQPVAPGFAPSTIWGEVPANLKVHATTAILLDAAGNPVASMPIVDGKFAFPSVAPGTYKVAVNNSAGATLATSEPVAFRADAVAQAFFRNDNPAGAAAATQGHHIGTAGWIAMGAVACGIAGGIIYHHNHHHDDGNASPSR